MTSPRDLVIVGGGPAGTEAALSARARGLDVVLVEPPHRLARRFALRILADELAQLSAEVRGTGAPADFQRLVRRAGECAAGLVDHRDRLLSMAGVDRLAGQATLTCVEGRVEVSTERSCEVLDASAVLIATGSRHVFGAGDSAFVGDDWANVLEAPAPPARAVVIGAGRDGVRLAGLLSAAGTAVSLIERRERVLPDADPDVAAAVSRALETAGVSVLPDRLAVAIVTSGGVRHVTVTAAGGRSEAVEADCVLVAAGRRPQLQGLGVERLATALDLPLPPQRYRTTLPWLLLAGTATGRSLTPEAARREGRAAIADLVGRPEHVPHAAVPTVLGGAGACGWSGLTEAQAKAAGHSLLVGRARLGTTGGAGFVKLVASASSNRVLGVHASGPSCREAVALGAAFVEAGGSRLDLAALTFPEGSPADALAEAAARATAP